MKMIKRAVRLLFLSLATTCAAIPMAATAGYPDHLVKVIVPYGPGGGVDTFTRPLAVELSRRTGQQFMVDNRAGAGGTIGVKLAAGSPADGYTILSGGVHQPMAEGLYPTRGYDMAKDFVPVALTAVVPNVLVVRPDLPVKNVTQFIEYAKANPGKVTYCSSGNGTSQHIIAEMFRGLTKTEMLHIPHKGTAPAMATLLSGQCDAMFDGLATSIAHIKGGKLKALALTSAKRSRHYPDIPTMQEAGGPAMDAGTWYGWWVPAGTPKASLDKLRGDLTAVLNSPEIQKVWATQGAEVPAVSTANVEAYVRAEIHRWTAATREANIKID
jgi:tripartite-type tricarboxylate transporter receptor subunit TctC